MSSNLTPSVGFTGEIRSPRTPTSWEEERRMSGSERAAAGAREERESDEENLTPSVVPLCGTEIRNSRIEMSFIIWTFPDLDVPNIETHPLIGMRAIDEKIKETGNLWLTLLINCGNINAN